MERSGAALTDHIIDVGGGASTLVDDLLDRGYQNLTVLGISSKADEFGRGVSRSINRYDLVVATVNAVRLCPSRRRYCISKY
jgi:hypothetical protein